VKRWGKYSALIIWMFLFSYLSNVLGVPKNIYYLLIGIPLSLGGVFLIFYFFERNNTKK